MSVMRTCVLGDSEQTSEQVLRGQPQIFEVVLLRKGGGACFCLLTGNDDEGGLGSSLGCFWLENEGLDELI